MRVLIADDEPGTRMLIAATLQRLGHDVVEAGTGDEALRMYVQDPPEVVITDLAMPGAIDGSGLISRVRALPDTAYAYVMVVTGSADEEIARSAMEAGADDLVLKPLDPADLERKLIAAARVTTLHRRLHRDARQDPLTGIGNRLRLAEDVEALCGRVARYGHAYCAALIDVDRFKEYNDAAGHLPGDDVLRAVADALAGSIRSGDTLYRYGGEEFLVLLPEQTLDTAAQAGERLRQAVEALALPRPGGGAVTVSVGVAGMGDASCTPEELFELADKALYRAKERGRNRVEVQPVGVEAPGEKPIRLLVADDDEGTRLMLSAIAGRDPGLELVGAAEDADEAIQMATARRPDVVLLDFDMPGGGGVRAAIDIREALPGVRIVAFSAYDDPNAQLDMTRAGAIGYLVKGADDAEITRTIRSAYKW